MRTLVVGEPPTMPTDPADLEFTADEMRRMGHATVERLVDHILSLETHPARGDVDAADLCRRLREPAPERGVEYEPLLDRLLAEWVPRSFTSSGVKRHSKLTPRRHRKLTPEETAYVDRLPAIHRVP